MSKSNNLQRHNLTLVGIILPSVWVGMIVLLILISFVSIRVGSIISLENLMLLTLVLSPVVYISGAVISIIALFISGIKKSVLLAAAINITLLVWWLTCSKPFLMEFELIG